MTSKTQRLDYQVFFVMIKRSTGFSLKLKKIIDTRSTIDGKARDKMETVFF